jgi:hypothetical protein
MKSSSMRWGSLLGITFALANCDMASGTGGRAIQFDMHFNAAASADASRGTFDTSTGWHVKLEQAIIALGPVYIYQDPPPLAAIDVPNRLNSVDSFWDFVVPNAFAHAGDEHFFGGEVKGEFLGQIAFDVLQAGGVQMKNVPGTEGRIRSASIWLAPPRVSIQGNGAALHGHHAYVVGTAEKNGMVIPFEGGLDIENEGTKRRVDGIPLDMRLDDRVALTVNIHLHTWFDAAHFDRLVKKNDQGRYMITPDSQVRTAWFLGARGFSAFSIETKQEE